jgi:hypothetical protein
VEAAGTPGAPLTQRLDVADPGLGALGFEAGHDRGGAAPRLVAGPVDVVDEPLERRERRAGRDHPDLGVRARVGADEVVDPLRPDGGRGDDEDAGCHVPPVPLPDVLNRRPAVGAGCRASAQTRVRRSRSEGPASAPEASAGIV